MLTISADQMLQDAAKFLELVEGGETLVITREGAPVAEIKPVEPTPQPRRPMGLAAGEFVVPADFDAPLPEIKPVEAQTRRPRVFGSMAGQFVVPDDFDAPLPDDFLDAFEGR